MSRGETRKSREPKMGHGCHLLGTDRLVGFRVLSGGVAEQSRVKGGAYLRYFGGPVAGQPVARGMQ